MAPFNTKRAKIDIAVPTIGDNVLVAAVPAVPGPNGPGRASKIVVFAIYIFNSGAGAQSIKLRSGTTDLTGPINLASGAFFHPTLTDNWEVAPIRTNAGEALVLSCSAATQVSGYLSYAEMA